MVVLLPLVLLAAAGVTYGLKRAPRYTASAALNVGVPDANSQATPGYVLAAEQLAASYSREVTSQLITGLVARRAGISQHEVAVRVSSSAIPNSPTFYVNATGTSSARAIALANAATDAVQTTVNANTQASSPARLLGQYRTLQAQANTLTQQSARLRGAEAVHMTTVPASRIAAIQVEAQVAQLRAQSAGERYTNALTAATGQPSNVVVLYAARTASGNRSTTTERYGIIGGLAGLVVGIVLAFLLSRLRWGREQRRRPTTR